MNLNTVQWVVYSTCFIAVIGAMIYASILRTIEHKEHMKDIQAMRKHHLTDEEESDTMKL